MLYSEFVLLCKLIKLNQITLLCQISHQQMNAGLPLVRQFRKKLAMRQKICGSLKIGHVFFILFVTVSLL